MIKLVLKLIDCCNLKDKQMLLTHALIPNVSPMRSQVDLSDPCTENSFVRQSQMDIT